MSKKIFISVLIFFLFFIKAKAQLGKEAWHWQFGYHSALDFSSGAPVAGTSSINTSEGCASISDAITGQLLFYTDGSSVWDRNNNQMPNGFGMIGGNGTSTQAALIVPKPGNSNIYYLISADEQSSPTNNYVNKGVHYSIVNMSLNGGLGDVVVASKNLLLTPPPATEKLVGIKHCNGSNYWIITHSFNSNIFNAYLVSITGIDTIPVTSSVGTVEFSPSNTFNETIGYLKVSPNGKKLALAVYEYIPILEIFDFDASTGKITNPIKITYSGNSGPYGISFSPDNTKLYASILETNELYQYDLSSGNPAAIISSQTLISSSNELGTMQIGPDGKIYIANNVSTFLSVINNPNNLGISCNFVYNAVPLLSSESLYGLPNFIEGISMSPIIKVSDVVQCTTFGTDTLQAGNGFNNYLWSTGDTTKDIVVNTPGTYWVTGSGSSSCYMTDTIKAYTINPNNIHLLKDTIVCSETNTYSVNVTCVGAQSYKWYDGTTYPVKTFTTSGTYSVNIFYPNGCVINNVFHLTLNTKPKVNLGHDTSLCQTLAPLTLYLNGGSGSGNTYLWSTGANTQTISVTTSGLFWVLVTNTNGCNSSDSINVQFHLGGQHSSVFDTVICNPNSFPVMLSVNNVIGNYTSYVWGNGEGYGKVNIIDSAGTYYVDMGISNATPPCLITDTFHVKVSNFVSPVIPDIFQCNTSKQDTLNAGPGYTHYVWSTGVNTQSIIVNTTGDYWVTVSGNFGCKETDTVKVGYYVSPLINVLKDTSVCSKNPLMVNASYPGTSSYLWNDGAMSPLHSIDSSGTYWVVYTLTTTCVVTDTLRVKTGNIIKPNIPDILQCNSIMSNTLDAGFGYSSYNWSTGANTQSIVVNMSNTYWVMVTNNIGCEATDTIKVGYYTSPLINILKDTAICNQESVAINASYPNTYSYLWSDGFTLPLHTLNSAGAYWVVYTLTTTCVASDTFNLSIKQVINTDSLPNIITPNNDGINDFIDFSIYKFIDMQLTIYDRWGAKVFESNEPNCIWKPTNEDGTYFYVITYVSECDYKNNSQTKKGFFTLLR